MDTSRYAVEHPVTICMLMVLLVLLGVLCIIVAEVELLPDISVPTLVVVTNRPKSSPQDVMKDITVPMEDVLNRTSRLKSISSISIEGQSRVQMEFIWGTDVDFAVMEVREKLNQVEIPSDAKDPYIWRWDPSSEPIFRFDIYDPSGRSDLAGLKRLADDTIKPRIERLNGVGSVTVFGGEENEIRVVLDQERLKAQGLTYQHVVTALTRESLNKRGGRIEGDRLTESVRILAEAKSAKDVADIVVAPKGTTFVKVRDVAVVEERKKDAQTYARINRRPTVGMTIKKSSGASTVAVIDRIQAQLAELRRSGIMSTTLIEVSQDDSEYILQAQHIVINCILQGSALAAMLLFIFLRNIPSTIIVVLAAPVSLIAAFILMHASHMSRNVLCLGGLALAGGMVLDSSIVILESIYKHIEYGKSPREAAIQGTSEVRLGVIASNLTTVAAFVPILLMNGIMKEIFRDLALAIIFSIIFSMVVGLLFIPMIASRIIKPKGAKREAPRFFLWRLVTGIAARVVAVMNKIDALMEALIGGILRIGLSSTLVGVSTVIVLLIVSAASLAFLPGLDFLPKGRVEEIWVTVEPPLGYSIDALDEKVTEIESILLESPDVGYVEKVAAQVEDKEAKLFVRLRPDLRGLPEYISEKVAPPLVDVAGAAGRTSSAGDRPHPGMPAAHSGGMEATYQPGPDPGRGRLLLQFEKEAPPPGAAERCVALLSKHQGVAEVGLARPVPGGIAVPVAFHYRKKGVPQVLDDMRRRFEDVAEVAIYVNLADKIGLGSGTPIQFKVSARKPDRHGLDDVQDYIKQDLVPVLKQTQGTFYVRAEKTEKKTEMSVAPDRGTISDLGITTAAISDTIRAMVYGVVPVTVKSAAGDIDVKVIGQSAGAAGAEFGQDDLEELEVASPTGSYNRIGEIADVTTMDADWKIERTDRKVTATLNADLVPYEVSGRTLGQVVAGCEKAIQATEQHEDFPYALKSTAKDNKEAWDTGVKAVIISVILIYVIMCCQFESYIYPLAIMFTMPLALGGIVVMLRLEGETMSLVALVGLISLGGVVVNNGIILVEFINILRRRGVDRTEAIIGGSKRKLRSILITSLTSVLGMLPIILGMGAGTELYRACAAVMFGGLLVSTPLTLIVLPIIYALLDQLTDTISLVGFRARALFTARS